MIKNSATNLFTGGLIMDLNPIITPNNVLTDALNATIVTNNGNEGVLLNDMGNGRVETAYLPEGYIPVGSCEFGDIIYIASYNPLINKCLLGCFPSPLRNISSSSVSNLLQSLSAEDFLELYDVEDDNGITKKVASGKLVSNSVKKIVYKNNLTAGDKYVIAALRVTEDGNYVTDLGNISHIKDAYPRLYKMKVVSIEDDGKVTELTNGLKWYNSPKDFFLTDKRLASDNNKIDIDDWRSVVSSAYSIFSSKVSGKLAILAELETITGFSCTWGVSTNLNQENLEPSDLIYNDYNIYFLLNWETDNKNINPAGIILTSGEWEKEDPIITYPINVNGDTNEYHVRERLSNNVASYPIDSTNIRDRLDATNYYHYEITRSYKPEKTTVNSYLYFDKLVEGHEDECGYDKQLQNTLETIRNSQEPYRNAKFNKIIRDDNGLYYLNAVDFYNDTYYTFVDNDKQQITPVSINDDIVNNEFLYPIKKSFNPFTLPVKCKMNELEIDLDLSNCIYKYTIAPYMPYGILEQYKQNGVIDFSKIGKKSIKLNTWKYYNQPGYSTLTWGMEAYTDPDHIISEVVLEFYDNFGKAAALHIPNKESYNGVFTNYITFDASGTVGLNAIAFDGSDIIHRGVDLSTSLLVAGKRYSIYNKITGQLFTDRSHRPVIKQVGPTGQYDSIDDILFEGGYRDDSDAYQYCESDAGILYSNKLYLVKINTRYCKIGPLGQDIEVDRLYEYRWFWTTTLFNDLYYQLEDFGGETKQAQFTLDLDPQMTLNTNDNWNMETDDTTFVVDPNSIGEEIDEMNPKSLSAICQRVTAEIEDNGTKKIVENLNIKVSSTFQNTHNGVYDLKYPTIKKDSNGDPILDLENNPVYENDGINLLLATIALGNQSLNNSPELPEVIFTDKTSSVYDGIYPKFDDLSENINGSSLTFVSSKPSGVNEMVDSYKNKFSFRFLQNYKNGSNLSYINPNLDPVEVGDYTYKEESLTTAYDKGFDICFLGEHFSKYYYTTSKEYREGKVVKTFITGIGDFNYYNLDPNYEVFTKMLIFNYYNYNSGRMRVGVPTIGIEYDATLVDGTENEFTDLKIKRVEELDDTIHKNDDRYEYSVLTIWNMKKLDVEKSHSFIYPYSWGGRYDLHESDETCKPSVYRDNNQEMCSLSPNKAFKESYSKNYFPATFVGCVGCISTSGTLNIADQYVTGNHRCMIEPIRYRDPLTNYYYYLDDYFKYKSAFLPASASKTRVDSVVTSIYDASPVYYGLRVSSILQNCFYFDKYENMPVFDVNNWIYLNTNSAQYNRDVIIKIDSNNKTENGNYTDNNCIRFNSWDYVGYLEDIKENSEVSLEDYEIFNSPNVNLKLNSCLKTFPFIILFKYIAPKMSYKKKLVYSVNAYNRNIKDTIEAVLNSSQIDILPNAIYCCAYDGASGETLKIDLLSQNCYFSIDKFGQQDRYNLSQDFISRLIIDNDRLRFSGTLYSSGTYEVILTNEFKYDTVPKKMLIFGAKNNGTN